MKTESKPRKLLKKREIAEIYGVCIKTIERWMADGLKHRKIRTHVYIKEEWLEDYTNKFNKKKSAS